VDSGRITEEAAKTHTRRSVLMRVLGDVDSSPEIDTEVLDTKPGDLWLLCSDGLCGYVEDDDVERILLRRHSLQGAVDGLIDKALSFGAPDNVTVVLVETQPGPASNTEPGDPRFAGSAATQPDEQEELSTARVKIMGRRRAIRRAQPAAESHFEPRVDGYLNELIAETKRRNRRRRLFWTLGLLAVVAVLLGGVALGYQWTQSRYFVGTDGQTVIIYQGVQQNIGSISLSSVAENTEIPLTALDGLERRQIERTLSAGSLEEAREIVARLGAVSTS
ncbi:MAG: serine/threonine-protein phosphatase, partial [Leucobacter sp.]|nr:serine/threonine-protein phosphatase [Leucobacter sp.]